MELLDFILEIDCLSHFYDWVCKHSYKSHLNNCCTGKREWAQLPRVSRALSVGTVHLSQVPNQLIWLLQKTLHRVPERGRGKKKKNGEKKRPWTEQVILEPNRIFSLNKLQDSVVWFNRNICKWAHWTNNLSLYFSGSPWPDALYK